MARSPERATCNPSDRGYGAASARSLHQRCHRSLGYGSAELFVERGSGHRSDGRRNDSGGTSCRGMELAMAHDLLFPPPAMLQVTRVAILPGSVIFEVVCCAGSACCPSCGSLCRRVYSRYVRRVDDLLVHGWRVPLRLRVRSVFCDRGTVPAARSQSRSMALRSAMLARRGASPKPCARSDLSVAEKAAAGWSLSSA